MNPSFKKGLLHGIPIALGYFSVSFGFGIMAVQAGLSVLAAAGISITNLTSAGQAAGVGIIASGGSLIEMALTQFIINLRYSLMSISLSQKLDPSFRTPARLLAAYGITDEIFAVAASQKGLLSPAYMYGLILISALGWTGGTLFGAALGSILPVTLTLALGILLYGMFLAIIIPPAKKDYKILIVILLAALLSCLFKYVFTSISSGFSIIICAIVSSVIGALFFPIKEEEES